MLIYLNKDFPYYLFSTVYFSQFLLFKKNNTTQTKIRGTQTSEHYFLVKKLKIGKKPLKT